MHLLQELHAIPDKIATVLQSKDRIKELPKNTKTQTTLYTWDGVTISP
jgi:glucosamine 6-phosphate synthetase-like amidotransferase/phosphosugar isomerase protein